jgi:copper(I)-binding protein
MSTLTTRPLRRRTAAAIALTAALALSACGSGSSGASDGADTTTQASAIQVRDPWIKAADQGMTAAFGTLTNSGDEPVTVIGASAASVAGAVELHEMAKDESGSVVMREIEGGLNIKADGSHELSPGGDHLMFLDLSTAIKPGDEVTITLKFADKSTLDFTAPARSFAGAQEDYDPNADQGHHEDHGH